MSVQDHGISGIVFDKAFFKGKHYVIVQGHGIPSIVFDKAFYKGKALCDCPGPWNTQLKSI